MEPADIIRNQLKRYEQSNSIVLKEIGNSLVEDAKDKAPSKTGHLKDSIEIKGTDKNSVTVGSDLSYAKFVMPEDINKIVGNDTKITKIIDKNIKNIF